MELEHYQIHQELSSGCNYIGHLKNETSALVAVTGCLETPEDKLEVTMISKHNKNKMFLLDHDGNAEVIKSPFIDGGE